MYTVTASKPWLFVHINWTLLSGISNFWMKHTPKIKYSKSVECKCNFLSWQKIGLWGICANKVSCSAQLFKLYYSVLKFMCMSLSASYLCMFVCLYVSICVHFFSRMCSCLWVFRCLVGLSYRIVKWRRQMSWAIQ